MMSQDSGITSDQAAGCNSRVFTTNITTPSSPITGISRSENITPTISGSGDGATSDEEGTENKGHKHKALGRLAGILSRTLSHSRESSITDEKEGFLLSESMSRKGSYRIDRERTPSNIVQSDEQVRETSKVILEYDPINKRRVLNTYEILREIGRGEHGKVKLARNLVNREFVAIKVVNRYKKDRSFKMRIQSSIETQKNDYQSKIKKEISIMKRCSHKHIVRLKEVLDDVNTSKIYLVLEYLEKGEIKWKRDINDQQGPQEERALEGEIPCCGSSQRRNNIMKEQDNLLSDAYSPNLTFKQSRKIFREVLLGLEYLHLHGIVHRDIKPANLLVSSDNIVKISDFGVSFASSINNNETGKATSDVELAKTAGTPAFFAPELCETNFSSTDSSELKSATSLELLRNDNLALTKIVPKINHKIDIWALGVTLFCLLFGKLPFKADSEYELFQVIVNQELEFPQDVQSFNSPGDVSSDEFELAKDLLGKLLDKNSSTRIDIPDIKNHPFVLMDLENDPEQLHEFFYLNEKTRESSESMLSSNQLDVSDQESNGYVIGIGSKIKKGLMQMMSSNSTDFDARARASENTISSSSNESSADGSNQNSLDASNGNSVYHSLILSEAFQVSTPPHTSPTNFVRNSNQAFENFPSMQESQIQDSSNAIGRTSSNSTAGVREGRNPNNILQDYLEHQQSSTNRKDSSSVSEAPQIETKRNVVGDVYLKNQSVLETFKGIQENDERRRSSIFSSNMSSTLNPNNSSFIAVDSKDHNPDTDTITTASMVATPIPITVSGQRELLPRNMVDESKDGERPTSVISLPLNESFASLDSFDDEFLTLKYEGNGSDDRQRAEFLRRASVSSQSETDLSRQLYNRKSVDGLNDKFKNFDLNSSMKQQAVTFTPNTINVSKSNGDPLERVAIGKTKSHRLSISSSSGSSESSDDDSEEEGNLTLAFGSKVKPQSRPNFLSLGNRAKSHDSTLPNLSHGNAYPTYDVPTVFQDYLPEFEDVPPGLMSGVPRLSVAGQGESKNVVSIISGSNSSATLTYDSSKGKMVTQTEVMNKEAPCQAGSGERGSTGLNGERKGHRREVSSLVKDAPTSEHATINSHLVTPKYFGNKINSYNNHFNNHYKKDPLYYPFPNAIHLDNDKNSKKKEVSKKQHSNRPDYYRSNSITMGILQQNHDPEE